jgi:fucose permease
MASACFLTMRVGAWMIPYVHYSAVLCGLSTVAQVGRLIVSRNGARLTLAISCLVFFSLGWLTAALGPVLPELAGRAGRSLADFGAIFTALFLGALCAQTAAGPISDRVGQRPVQLVGMAIQAIGTLGVLFSRSFPMTLGCALFAGLGHGSVDVATNVLIAEVFPGRSVSALNLLNLFFGVGAVAGPALAGFALATWSTGLPALWAVVVMIVLLWPIVYRFEAAGRPAHGSRPLARRAQETGRSGDVPSGKSGLHLSGVYASPLLWMLGALLLVYVGMENGMGGWTTTYIQRTTPLKIEVAALVTSGYWLALTVGRLLSTFLGIRLSSHRVLTLSLTLCAVAGPLLALSAGSVVWTIVGVLLLGLGSGAVFPTTLAVITGTFRRQGPGKAASVGAAMGSIGGMSLPWIQGRLMADRGPVASMIFVAASAAVMTLLYWGARAIQGHGGTVEGALDPARLPANPVTRRGHEGDQ